MTERLAVEANGTRLDEQRFPGRQGRILFAYLAAQKGRPVPRDELAELLWGEELPATWEKALRVLMTKLRALLNECGIDGASALTSAFGCYQLTLPEGAWIGVRRGRPRLRSRAGFDGGRACASSLSARRGRSLGRRPASRPPRHPRACARMPARRGTRRRGVRGCRPVCGRGHGAR